MRIGVDATCWSNRRGFGRFARELLKAIAMLDSGDEYVLFTDRETAERAEFPCGWSVVIGETRVAPSRAASAVGHRSLRDMWVMRRAVERVPLDLLFFPAVYSYFPVGGRVPCLVTFHDVIAETFPHLVFQTRRSRWFWHLKCRSALRRADRVVTVSQAAKAGLMRVFGLPDERIRVIPEAASAAFGPVECGGAAHQAALARYGIDPRQRYVLYVGGLSPHKNLDRLIEAFAQVHAEAAHAEVRLVLVGDRATDSFRTCYEDLRRRVGQLGVAEHVHFPGYVPDAELAHLYAQTEAFVSPSYLEGFGLPVVEAMACGAAVLASDRGSLPEVLGGAGHLFNPTEVGSLAGGLRRVLAQDDYREELRSRSRVRAKHFSWDQAARRAIEIFHERADGHGTGE